MYPLSINTYVFIQELLSSFIIITKNIYKKNIYNFNKTSFIIKKILFKNNIMVMK